MQLNLIAGIKFWSLCIPLINTVQFGTLSLTRSLWDRNYGRLGISQMNIGTVSKATLEEFWETGLSEYGLFQAHTYHLELNWKLGVDLGTELSASCEEQSGGVCVCVQADLWRRVQWWWWWLCVCVCMCRQSCEEHGDDVCVCVYMFKWSCEEQCDDVFKTKLKTFLFHSISMLTNIGTLFLLQSLCVCL